MKYDWIENAAYENWRTLKNHVEKVLTGFGKEFVINFAVRRAKLGFVCGVKVPILEALARRQVLSVASATATAWAKRTQGGDGPQCESVKG